MELKREEGCSLILGGRLVRGGKNSDAWFFWGDVETDDYANEHSG